MTGTSGNDNSSVDAAAADVMATTPRRHWRRLAWSAAVVGACALGVVCALMAPVEDVLDTPMSRQQSGWIPQATPLLETAGPPPPVYILRLRLGDITGLLTHPEVRILVTTYGTRVRFTSGTIEMLGTPCRYEVPSGERLADDALLRFVRDPGCATAGYTPTGELKLTIRLAKRSPVGVWTFVPPPGTDETTEPMIRLVGIPGHTGPAPVLRGKYVNYTQPSGLRRIDLLNYVWQVSPSTGWIWLTLAAAALAGLGGAWLLPMRAGGDMPGSSTRATLATTAGMFLLAAGVGLPYAVMVPPFQAADEPDHFLSYARMTGNSSLSAAAAQWARLGQFERIRFHTDERFRPIDVGKPSATSWNEGEVFAEDVLVRSTTTAWWWKGLSQLPARLSAERQLLWIRLANVLLFAACVGSAAALLNLTAAADVAYPQLLACTFLLVPSLPFFAMHVSEFAVLCAIYVMLAACMLAFFLDSPRSSWLGAPLGFVVAVMMASGRSALPMVPIVAAALLARVALGERGRRSVAGHLPRSVVFWAGLSLSLTAVTLVLDAAYPPPVDLFPPVAEKTLLPAFRWVWNHSWILGGLGLLGFLFELVALRWRNAVSPSMTGRIGRGGTWFCYSAAALVIGSFAWSLVADYPRLQTLEAATRPTVAQYVTDVLAGVLTTFRLSEPDLLLTSSFIAGFGWVDTLPGNYFMMLLVAGVGTALIGLLVLLARRHDPRRVAWLAMIGVGWIAAVALYAVATHGMTRNLHGRYLVGPYLCILAVFLSGTALTRSRVLDRFHIPPPGVALLIAGGIHAYCLRVILMRYF